MTKDLKPEILQRFALQNDSSRIVIDYFVGAPLVGALSQIIDLLENEKFVYNIFLLNQVF